MFQASFHSGHSVVLCWSPNFKCTSLCVWLILQLQLISCIITTVCRNLSAGLSLCCCALACGPDVATTLHALCMDYYLWRSDWLMLLVWLTTWNPLLLNFYGSHSTHSLSLCVSHKHTQSLHLCTIWLYEWCIWIFSNISSGLLILFSKWAFAPLMLVNWLVQWWLCTGTRVFGSGLVL